MRDSDWAQKILKLAKIEQYQYQYQWITFIDICIYQYEEEWINGAENVLTRFDKIFWSENVCVLSACLSEKQMRLYLIAGQSAPHLSVIKATEQKWEEIGLFVRKCLSATDWIEKTKRAETQ